MKSIQPVLNYFHLSRCSIPDTDPRTSKYPPAGPMQTYMRTVPPFVPLELLGREGVDNPGKGRKYLIMRAGTWGPHA